MITTPTDDANEKAAKEIVAAALTAKKIADQKKIDDRKAAQNSK